MDPWLLLSPRTSPAFLDQTQKFLWRCRTPLPFHPQPSAELCRRGSCYTLIRGDSNNTDQLSYPAPGFGAPCARTALGGASPGCPAIPVPPRARCQRCSRDTAGHGPGSGDSQHCWQTEPLPRRAGGRCCTSAGSPPEPPAHPVPPAGSAIMVRSSPQRDGRRGRTISAPPPPRPAFPR